MHVYRTYFPDEPGGLQEAIRQICFCSGNHGIQHTIFTLSPNPEPAELILPEARVLRCRSWAAPKSCDIGDWNSISCFSHMAARSDILHFHFPWPFADLLNWIIRPSTPAILTYHSDIVRQRIWGKIYNPLMQWMIRNVRIIIATSPAYVRTSPVLSCPSIRDKVSVIPLGIAEHTYPAIGDDTVFNRIGLKADRPYFLFIGKLRYYKGLHTLVKAAQNVKANVVIAGTGPEERNLRLLSGQIGTNNILFAGQVTDAEKVALLRKCSAVVLPSHLRSEAFGMVLLEAAMFRRPLISCDIGTGTTYVNQNGKTGFVVSPESHQELSSAMNMILESPDMAEKMGAKAREHYELNFSGDSIGKSYDTIYRDLTVR